MDNTVYPDNESDISMKHTGSEKRTSSFFGINPKTMLRTFIFVFALIPTLALYSQSPADTEKIKSRLSEYPEVYLSIESRFYSPELALLASMDYSEVDRVFLYVNREAFDHIENQGIEFRVEKSPGTVDFDLNMLDVDEILQKSLTDTWDFYPTYEAYVALMYQFEQDFPDLVKIHNIGTTVMGRDLLFAQIGPDVDQQRDVPQFMYTSTMHGDETTGFILSLRLIHHLINNYGTDAEITQLMDQVEIWICPNENPDGTYTNNNATVNGATRSNANGKDLNRNYPGPHPSHPNPPVMPLQPETLAMIEFAESKNFIMSANMHGGIELVNYPWDSWLSSQQLHADHDWWGFVMYEYVDTVHAYSVPGYMTGMGDGVTHGGDWYVVYGSRQDYFNYFHSCREFTLELSNQKLLSPSLLPAHWEYNYRSLINYIKQATYGFHGWVKDAQGGEPLLATLHLKEHDQLNSEVITRMPNGYFSRPVIAGTYDIEFIADGFQPVSMDGVTISNYERMELKVFLGENVQALYVYASDDEGGSVSGSGIYPAGHEVLISAVPEPGYELLYWENAQGDIVSEMPEFTHTMTSESIVFYAVFHDVPTEFAVHFAAGEGSGSVAARIDGMWISSGFVAPAGSDVEFIATPQTGYEVSSWKVNGVMIPGFTGGEYLAEDLQTVINLTTNFSQIHYLLDIVVETPGSGQVYVTPNNETFHYGQTVNLSAVPAHGYVFQSWVDNNTEEVLSVYDTFAFSMPAHNMDITAVFEHPSHMAENHPTAVRVFPNPARDQLSVEADFAMESLELTDESGKVILNRTILNSRSYQIPLHSVAPGFYLLRIQGAEITAVKKVQVF
ncbi:MAG: T9SS C-terminal target domain-containing protein [Bacteroidetes bacterium]|nr:MAG: T9SS C-terminal target domain-containing protein [Bacteroidota bacterium]